MKLPWILFRLFLFTSSLVLSFGLSSGNVAGQAPACNVTSNSNCRTSTGPPDYCPSGQIQCQGTNDSGGVCYTCGQTSDAGATCSLSSDSAVAPDGSATTCGELYGITGDPNSNAYCASISNNMAACNVVDSKTGCKYCSTPICTEPGTFAFDGKCVHPISCSVYEALPTGPSTADAKSKVNTTNTDDFAGYDSVNWYLNGNLVGTTAMDQNTGNASNSFTNLVAGTSYTLTSQYFDNQGGRPAVDCSGYTFQFNPSSSQMSCSLTPSYSSINEGGSVTWNLTNDPAGSTAVMKGTNPTGSQYTENLSPYNGTSWSATRVYNDSGSYQRYAEIRDSSGTLRCTTDTSQVFVNSQNCRTFSLSPTSLSFTPGGQGQTVTASGADGNIVSWSTTDFSIARLSQSSCSPTGSAKSCSITVFPGTKTGTARITGTDPGGGRCVGETIGIPATVSNSSTAPPCPGACADSNGTQLNPSQCNGTWSYTAGGGTNKDWDTSCNQQKNASFGWYCYVCDTGPGGGPVPTAPPAPPPPFATGSIYVKGPLLIGKILQDFNKSFTIDALDTVIDRVTSTVTGIVQTVNNSRLTITGRSLNIIRGDPVYNMCTKSGRCGGFCSTDDRAVQQAVIFPGESSLCTGKVYNPPASVSLSATSDFIKIPNETTCDTPDGCDHKTSTSGSFTQTTTSAPNPVDSFSSKLAQKHDYRPGYNNSLTDEHTDTFSYVPGDVGPGSCVNGCAVKTKESRTFSTTQNSGPTGQAPQCGGNSPYRYSDPRLINPDGTCFVTLKTFGSEDQLWELDPNQAYTRIYGACIVGSSSSYSWNYYKGCSRYSFGGDSARTPWSVSYTSPAVTNDPPTSQSWRDFFDFQTPDSCSYNSNTGKYDIVPSSIAPYCTCEVTQWCDKDGCTDYSDYDCNFPQKAGRSFTPAPPGDYLFELTTSGTNSVDYSITAGGTALASGNAPVSNGKISVKFNVPSSSVGQRIDIKFSQSSGGVESVTFGKPGLYPLGWYEASVDFGRTSTTSLDDAFVVDPPPDYPYTIGMVPPDGNYCPKSSAIDQCYKNLAQAPLNSNNLNRVDFLLGDSKAGPWFQVKDADLQANGNISSNIPAVCKSPQCVPELGLPGLGGYPGIPAFVGKMDLGNGTVSAKGWNALSKYSGRKYDYSFFKSRIPSGKLVNLADRYTPGADGSITIGPTEVEALAKEFGSGGNVGYLLAPGKLVFNGNSDVKDNKIVFFVEGSFEIKGKINLDDDKGFFGAFVKGDISIDPGVSQPQKPSIEGAYMADGLIKTGTNKPAADNQLIIRGMMVGWSGITLERNLDPDRQTGQNDKQPAEFIEYAPDLVLNFPKELLREGSVWREIAP